MTSRYLNIWKWLLFIASGLILARLVAPISDSLDEVLLGVAIAIQMTFYGIYFWQERRGRRADQSRSAAISSRDQM
jgi:nicotinamide riboside transporter PnuC